MAELSAWGCGSRSHMNNLDMVLTPAVPPWRGLKQENFLSSRSARFTHEFQASLGYRVISSLGYKV